MRKDYGKQIRQNNGPNKAACVYVYKTHTLLYIINNTKHGETKFSLLETYVFPLMK